MFSENRKECRGPQHWLKRDSINGEGGEKKRAREKERKREANKYGYTRDIVGGDDGGETEMEEWGKEGE